jgi:hypothetical protein
VLVVRSALHCGFSGITELIRTSIWGQCRWRLTTSKSSWSSIHYLRSKPIVSFSRSSDIELYLCGEPNENELKQSLVINIRISK